MVEVQDDVGRELQRLLQCLPEVHVFLYSQYDQCSAGAYSGRLFCVKAVSGDPVPHGTGGTDGIPFVGGHLRGILPEGERVLEQGRILRHFASMRKL